MIIDKRGRLNLESVLLAMNRAARHRGPDGSGIFVDGPVGLAHTRLSIIDLSDQAAQPMSRAPVHLSFNGEIYNYVELRQELASEGWQFNTKSDTEVLLAALSRWGVDSALDRLMGMFAFAYFDASAGKIHLVRDRFGKKPLVYTEVDGVFCAASEPKQLLEVPGVGRRLNRDIALDFLAHGHLNRDDRTFFEGIREIRGGEAGVYDLATHRFSIRRWYDLGRRVAPIRPSYFEARDTVRHLLYEAVRRRHRADVPVGACLSGGIDSSAIVSLSAAIPCVARLRTITTYADHDGYDEREFSREVVKKHAVESIEVEPDTHSIWEADRAEELAYYQDQPLPSGSHYNEYHVFKAARENGLIVMLDGQGADEYFGGYGEFWRSAALEALGRGDISGFSDAIAMRADAHGWSRAAVARRLVRSVLGRPVDGGVQIGNRPVRWLRAARPTAVQPHNFRELSVAELVATSIPYQVHSEDRNSMRWSVESRIPFLDHLLVEYVLGLPTEYKVGKGYQKRILRDAVPELPEMIAKRKVKIGFASPDATSMRGREVSVRSQLESTLSLFSREIDGNAILSYFNDMVRSLAWYDPLFYRLASLGAWIRRFDVKV